MVDIVEGTGQKDNDSLEEEMEEFEREALWKFAATAWTETRVWRGVKRDTKIQHKWFYRTFLAFPLLLRAVVFVFSGIELVVPFINVTPLSL